MDPYSFKRLSDSVHGTIGLSELEFEIIDTPVFQRLRNVAQLGLAKLAFPGVDYSRFTHSIGVCHMTGRILDHLRNQPGLELDDASIQNYRLAGLLHDVGHYPFSHAFEHAIEDRYAGTLIVKKNETEQASAGADAKPTLKHEEVGEQILLLDEDISRILSANSIDPEEIYRIFRAGPDLTIKNLISSDFDADRIDYLLRTSHHSGLPYGSIDIDYLLSQMKLDSEGRICISEKGLKAADHFLLCRYFDFQQLTYHKTVTGFEQLLKQLLRQLLDTDYADYSPDSVKRMIRERSWASFDDSQLLASLREKVAEGKHQFLKIGAESILQRKPPTLVAEMEYIDDRKQTTEKNFFALREAVLKEIPKWAEIFGIDEQLWFDWSLPGAAITSIGATVSVGAPAQEIEDVGDEVSQLIHILKPDGSSDPIVTHRNSLMSRLADFAVYALRVYVLLDSKDKPQAENIRQKVREDLPHHQWQER